MRKLTLLSAAHLCVDLSCAALFFGWLDKSADWWLYMVLYNAWGSSRTGSTGTCPSPPLAAHWWP